ncbi:MAG: hypothetical protein ACI4E1_12325 [Lachnospira sp.]
MIITLIIIMLILQSCLSDIASIQNEVENIHELRIRQKELEENMEKLKKYEKTIKERTEECKNIKFEGK